MLLSTPGSPVERDTSAAGASVVRDGGPAPRPAIVAGEVVGDERNTQVFDLHVRCSRAAWRAEERGWTPMLDGGWVRPDPQPLHSDLLSPEMTISAAGTEMCYCETRSQPNGQG